VWTGTCLKDLTPRLGKKRSWVLISRIAVCSIHHYLENSTLRTSRTGENEVIRIDDNEEFLLQNGDAWPSRPYQQVAGIATITAYRENIRETCFSKLFKRRNVGAFEIAPAVGRSEVAIRKAHGGVPAAPICYYKWVPDRRTPCRDFREKLDNYVWD